MSPVLSNIRINERHQAMYDLWVSGKSFQKVADVFGVSRSRVAQVVKLHKEVMKRRQELSESPDPVVKALDEGKISLKVYNSLVRGGYGKRFDFEELLDRLRTDTFDPNQFFYIGEVRLNEIREAFLNPDEVVLLATKKNSKRQPNGSKVLQPKIRS